MSSKKGVRVEPAPVSQLPALVNELHEPWIADEGPLDCGLRRGLAAQTLRQRGIAFDHSTTIVWDEDEVQVIRAAATAPDITALVSPVLVRAGLAVAAGWPRQLSRIDYLREGALIASRYTWIEQGKGHDHA